MKKNNHLGIALAAAMCIGVFGSFVETNGVANEISLNPPIESTMEKNARMQWWRDARFGMFIHWGVYAVPAGAYNGHTGYGEWIMYEANIPVDIYRGFAKQFNPVEYSPEEWVLMAKKTGMKYIVITSKHHEGFALFDSAVTDWDVVDATPYGKDLIKPLAEACRKHGMKFGFYYSQSQDWNHPGGGAYKAKWDKRQEGDFTKYINEIAIPQVRELLTKYGKIDIFWWDTPSNMTPETAAPLFALVHELQPGIVTNDRLGGGFPGDSATPEQFIPSTGYGEGRDWEVCMTLNNIWGYSAYDKNWKTPETVIKNLVDIASKGGNYILNMGPRADGTIPDATVTCFQEVGNWMHINGDAIYGTTASPFRRLAWGRCTKKVEADGVTLYLHVFDGPENNTLFLPGLKNEIVSANTMFNPVKVQTTNAEEGVYVKVPGMQVGNLERPMVIALKLKGILQVEPMCFSYKPSPNFDIPVTDADLQGNLNVERAADNIDNIGYWTHTEDYLEWNFKVSETGKYEIVTEAALESDSELSVFFNGNKIKDLTVEKTGGYKDFSRKVSLGTIECKAGEKVSLRLVPVKEKWSPINIRKVQAISTK